VSNPFERDPRAAGTVTFEHLCNLTRHQARSAEMWIGQYYIHQDAPSVRAAAMAIGKVAGHYNILVSTGMELPEDILAIELRMTEVWADLRIKE
jgi:hypothetical protein